MVVDDEVAGRLVEQRTLVMHGMASLLRGQHAGVDLLHQIRRRVAVSYGAGQKAQEFSVVALKHGSAIAHGKQEAPQQPGLGCPGCAQMGINLIIADVPCANVPGGGMTPPCLGAGGAVVRFTSVVSSSGNPRTHSR